MLCQAVMHDYFSVRMPKIETSLEMLKEQEISQDFYTQFLFSRVAFKI